ncbi:MAG: LPS export ABC transporter periplasmic protein LptC [Steroidobacteraceae bacterium]|jgi:LPS export ABC transporter protein LptC
MILRLLFALGSLAILGALLYFEGNGDDSAEGSAAEQNATSPGYVAIRAQLIETGEDGQPLYRLDASRIDQPQPQGTIYLTSPKLDYEPEGGNRWTLTAQSGQMPQDARSADLHGNVHAEGKPSGSNTPVRIDTEELHFDMAQQVATSPSAVLVNWGRYRLDGRGMRADLKNDRLQLASQVRGVLVH